MTDNTDQHYDELYKVVLVGDPGVGKTNMLAYFTSQGEDGGVDDKGVAKSFNALRKPTIGVEFGTRIVLHPSGKRIKAQIWDTAGQERYRAITSSHYRRAAGALLVYDVSARDSFTHACEHWLKELRGAADESSGLLSSVMLVGNKTDIKQSPENSEKFVSENEHNDTAQSLNLLSYRSSAKTGENVVEAFEALIVRIYDNDKSKAADRGGCIALKDGSGSGVGASACC